MATPIDFSQTQRIVLLIDLNPFLHLQNPNPYITSILTTSQILLNFPSLSTSLFAFKLFFSSLSPLRSSSSLHRLLSESFSPSLSFNRPTQTLDYLSTTLNSLTNSPLSTELASLLPSASHTTSALLQLVHDYAWESQLDNPSGKQDNFPVVPSNLILLLSPISRSLKCLSEFVNANIDDESLRTGDVFCEKFCEFFGAVNDAFVSRDIHFSWVDVKYELECDEEKSEIDETLIHLELFENGIRNLGWGFCSTDSIVLGSALIPFELIYPKIGISFNFLNSNDFHKSIGAQLALEISDVNGKSLECKCCDLELLHLKTSPRLRSYDIIHTLESRNSGNERFDQDETFWGHFGDGTIKLNVKAVQRYALSENNKAFSSDHILLRGLSGESGQSRKKCSGSFFADEVLEILSREMGEFFERKTIPIWQILLSFLYRKGCWALVSLSNGNGDSRMGILKPFTAHLALLSIIDNKGVMVYGFGGSHFAQIDDEICKPCVNINSTGFIDSQFGSLSSRNYVPLGDEKRKKKKKQLGQDLTWSSFHKAAFEFSKLDLEEVYLAREFNNSKKLKFLKCWMKQIKKSNCCSLTIPDGYKSCQHNTKEKDDELTGTHQEKEKPIFSCFSVGPSEMQEEAVFVSCPETSETFFSDLPKKIQQGLESEGVDLQILAERIVNLSIHWLYQKREVDNSMESQSSTIKSDDTGGRMAAAKLVKLLLREPKELKEKHKENGPSFQASDPRSTSSFSENLVREYELQILLRMEILRSKAAESIEESTKRKLLKHIYSLLEVIQYLVDGGFRGHVSLYDYVERTIKSRYSHTLGDVVKKIYAKMDLLPFGGENESPILLFNSEDSNQSWREKPARDGMGEINRIHESISAEDESSQPMENNDESPQGIKREEHALKLSEARERRERARRFVSFTSWVPDLQRVWAPKHPKAMKAKSESLQKQRKKERRRASYDVVCETPLTRNKRSCSQRSSVGDEEHHDHGSNSSSSVSKALFQDDC